MFLLFCFFMILMMNLIFLFNSTVYMLLGTVGLLLAFCCILLFYELEFFALIFGIMYVGGILVMFMFFMMVISMIDEHEQDKYRGMSRPFFFKSVLILIFSLFLQKLFFYFYNPFVSYIQKSWMMHPGFKEVYSYYYDSEFFIEAFAEATKNKTLSLFEHIWYSIYLSIYGVTPWFAWKFLSMDGRMVAEYMSFGGPMFRQVLDGFSYIMEEQVTSDSMKGRSDFTFTFMNEKLTEINFFNLTNFFDIYIIGVELFKNYSIFVMFMAFMLLFAVFVSNFISTSMFKGILSGK